MVENRPLRPLLEVDAFQWPPECERLTLAAGYVLDRLAEQVIELAQQGRKVVAISGCRRGEGCTTLVLALAPRLVRKGLKVVLVDADFHHPRLAQRLGLLPEAGWEQALAGRLPLAEVAVESVRDRFVLLPLRELQSAPEVGPTRLQDPAVVFGALRRSYDVVLVDLGRFHRHESGSFGPPKPQGNWIDAVVLVHSVRSTSREDLARNRRRVREAGIYEAGIVENFVA